VSTTVAKADRRAARFALRAGTRFVAHLPASVRQALASALGRGFAALPLRRRRVALDNIALAFPALSPAARRALLRATMVYWAQTVLEVADLAGRRMSDEELRARVTLEGKAHLDAALAQGRGVIALSAHIGNFPLAVLALAAYGYRVAAVYKEGSALATDFFGRLMRAYGVVPIRVDNHRQSVARGVLSALREGGVVLMQIDQAVRDGILVEFFGRPARTPVGPAVLARRSGAPVLPMFMLHEGRNHQLDFAEPLPLDAHADPQQAVHADVQAMTRVIEAMVRAHPAEWYWVHRRWADKGGGG
jgi:KDO2-lipid IV(A) lauroyltransferase